MNSPTLLARVAPLALLAPFALACTAGGDIYVESHAGSSQSSLACVVAPGEDICARSFEGIIAPEKRPAVVGALALVAEFAGIAREGRDEITRACEAIVGGLGGTRPTGAPGAGDNMRTKAICDAAFVAVGKVDRSSFSLGISPSKCIDVPHPSCATKDVAPGSSCGVVGVTLTMFPGASARAAADGVVLQKSLATLATFKTRLDALARLTGAITANASALADGEACAPSAVALIGGAIEEVRISAEVSSLLVGAIAP